jgi:hypothetical protein
VREWHAVTVDLEQAHHALRGTRNQSRPTLGEQTRARRRQSVDIFLRGDTGDHRVLIVVIGERQLDEDPIDGVIGAQLADQLQQPLGRGRSVEIVVDRVDPRLLGQLALRAHV